MKELNYPFQGQDILIKRKKWKRRLLTEGVQRMPLRIAILGGSTTDLLKEVLELFLLNEGIAPVFYIGEFGRYFEEAIFENEKLQNFGPDLIFFHTGCVNITQWPEASMTEEEVEELAKAQMDLFEKMWNGAKKYHCKIMQNNFEMPFFRLRGNMDGIVPSGRTSYIHRINNKIAAYGRENNDFILHDICYLSAQCGLERWHDTRQWYQAHMCPGTECLPDYCYSISRVISDCFLGKKKVIVTDLDDTMWKGIVSEVGPEGLNMTPDTPSGEAHCDYQKWLLEMSRLGIVLCGASKNDEKDALAGLERKECLIKPEQLSVLKANWGPKDRAIEEIAKQLNLYTDSMVFIDDNKMERNLVEENLKDVSVLPFESIEDLLWVVNRSQMFQIGDLTEEDLKRVESYRIKKREEGLKRNYDCFEDYLKSLSMKLMIKNVDKSGLIRMEQLIKKTHRFHMTNVDFSERDLLENIKNPSFLILGGKLEDQLGEYGTITYLIGKQLNENRMEVHQWVMSCRVFGRGVEHAVMDYLVQYCKDNKIKEIIVPYDETEKNAQLKKLLVQYGFREEDISDSHRILYTLDIDNYKEVPYYIEIVN